MRIIQHSQADIRSTDTVFRQSVNKPMMGLLVGIMLMIVGLWVLTMMPHTLPWFIAVFLILFGLLFTYLFGLNVQAARRDTNWLLRVGASGTISIKFRSYLNWRFSDQEPQVIVLVSSEITSARRVTARRVTSSRDSTQFESQEYVELALHPPIDSALAEALRDERAHRGFGKRHRTRYHHAPVHLIEGNILRLNWRTAYDSIVPNVAAALDALRPLVPIEADATADEDYSVAALSALSPEEQKQRLIRLAQVEDMKAVTTVRKLYDYSLADSRKYVEELRAAPPVARNPS
ncbi:MAG TPA: DUF308 domain-containing protein [Tepidisphaeraceae bacterium]